MRESTTSELLARFRQGDRRACGQVISRVEDDDRAAQTLLHELYPLTGRAYRIGVTGPPGAGKSTLVDGLARVCRAQSMTVGIVAVDPTSPYSGGAILGDRIRMTDLFTDPGVFIRSMGSRGSLGGLAHKTKEVCDVLDAFGHAVILIETIGVGQVELDIAGAADSTIVVLVPESGDSIQAMKAGLMEVGDLFAINKSDREGADRMAMEVEAVLEMRDWGDGWKPRVIRTVAVQGTGVTDLLNSVWNHRSYLAESRSLELRRRETVRREIVELVGDRFNSELWGGAAHRAELDDLLDRTMKRKITPYQAAEQLWKTWSGRKGG